MDDDDSRRPTDPDVLPTDRASGDMGQWPPGFDIGDDGAGCGAGTNPPSSLPRLSWRDVEHATARLAPADRETLKILIRVPFATVTLLGQLDGLRGGAAI